MLLEPVRTCAHETGDGESDLRVHGGVGSLRERWRGGPMMFASDIIQFSLNGFRRSANHCVPFLFAFYTASQLSLELGL